MEVRNGEMVLREAGKATGKRFNVSKNKHRISAGFLLMSTCCCLLWAQNIRKPAVSGMFYKAGKEALSRDIDDMLSACSMKPELNTTPSAIIVPHAGYVYSGGIAACAYQLVRDGGYSSVAIVGPSHRVAFEGCSIYSGGAYETPLGRVQIDKALSEEVKKITGFGYVSEAHVEEHSIEVQVPFVQKILPRARIVPILVGIPRRGTIQALAAALIKISGRRNVLVVISTDMSHFLSHSEAGRIDRKTLDLVERLDGDALAAKLARRENILCGGAGVAAVLLAFRKLKNPRLKILKYGDSSDFGGPTDRVVGYFSAALYSDFSPQEPFLTAEEKSKLLKIARSAVLDAVKNQALPNPEAEFEKFAAAQGAFVTLRKKGRLRGCIGFAEPIMPLVNAVAQAAFFAAGQDPRFSPVTEAEFGELEIEISVLTPPRKIENPDLVEVGTHGLIIEQDGRRGLLLPQVPVENRWSRRIFLEQTCLKAGLDKNAWKAGARLYVFRAFVFHESDER